MERCSRFKKDVLITMSDGGTTLVSTSEIKSVSQLKYISISVESLKEAIVTDTN